MHRDSIRFAVLLVIAFLCWFILIFLIGHVAYPQVYDNVDEFTGERVIITEEALLMYVTKPELHVVTIQFAYTSELPEAYLIIVNHMLYHYTSNYITKILFKMRDGSLKLIEVEPFEHIFTLYTSYVISNNTIEASLLKRIASGEPVLVQCFFAEHKDLPPLKARVNSEVYDRATQFIEYLAKQGLFKLPKRKKEI